MTTAYNQGNDAYKSGGGGGSTGVQSVVAGAGISVDNTDPQNPVVSSTITQGVQTVTGGLGIEIDNTDPDNPVVSSEGVVALKTGDTPDFLENKLYARPDAIVKINEVMPGAGFFQMEIASNLEAGAGIAFSQPDPAGPVIIEATGSGGGVQSVVAGVGIDVDNTDPANPIINNTGTGPGAVAGLISMPLATCRNAVAIPGVNNAGALLATLTALSADVTIKKLGIWVKQTGGGSVTLGIYNSAGTLLAKTASFTPSSTGYKEQNITTDGSGGAITEIALTGNNNYYLAVHGNQASNGAQYYGQDVGTTFGPTPWLGWGKDNIASMPNSISGGSESAQRFMMVGRL